MKKKRNALRLLTAASAAVVMLPDLVAQYDDVGDDVVMMNPFVVDTSKDIGYLSTNSTSGTSLNTALKELPMSVQVINQDFMNDQAATDMEEALEYAAGVYTSDNQASSGTNSASATRAVSGGDKSISSAGSDSRFANVAYIRGLSVPFQNRLGFRYGGLVVTTNSSIALGGLLDAVNIDRMEVVKGPNSLLYGVGVLTGIVNVIPEKPLNEPHYEFKAKIGSYDYYRVEADLTGPVPGFFLPGELNYRIAGSYQEKGDWTDYKSTETEYYTFQLDYNYEQKFGVFLEYQNGNTRKEGIGSQWIYDNMSASHDSEFRNEYDEAYNWAQYSGDLTDLRVITGIESNVSIENSSQTTTAYSLGDEYFTGGGMDESYRISGPDTYAERDEWSFLADAYLTPFENFTIRAGYMISHQRTEELNLHARGSSIFEDSKFSSLIGEGGTSSDALQALTGYDDISTSDPDLVSLYQNGGLYGRAMGADVRDYFGLTTVAVAGDFDDGVYDYVIPGLTDDIKVVEYWWEKEVVESDSRQWRASATYTFETPFIGGPASHTFLAGLSYINDQVDFPDGSVDDGNAISNRASVSVTDPDSGNSVSVNVNNYADDGLYFRSIADFSEFSVDGCNIIRAGDVYLGQDITQRGDYLVYQGKFFNDKLEMIWGIRHDSYNANEWVYDRVNLDDFDYYSELYGVDSFEELVAAKELTARTVYTEWIEGENSGLAYYGAKRYDEPDQTYGIVPGTFRQVLDEDYEATTHTFALNYDLTDSLTIYGVMSEGISPNTALKDGNGEIIPAEETENREIGLKFDFWDGKLSGSLAYFTIDRYNAIWDIEDYAPAPAKWQDAEFSENRDLDWSADGVYTPDYYWDDDEVGSHVREYIREDYFYDYMSEVFGVDSDALTYNAVGRGDGTNYMQQGVDKDAALALGYSTMEWLMLNRDVKNATTLPEGFLADYDSQAPFSGALQIGYLGLDFNGYDDVYDITVYDLETNSFITKSISSVGAIYQAFMDRAVDKTRNDLFQEIHPIRYRRFAAKTGGELKNNNVTTSDSSGALVTFDETIKGYEAEVVITPNENWQFVLGYSHTEREANDSWNFVEFESIVTGELEMVDQFNMFAREYGWTPANIKLAWVDSDAYEAAKLASWVDTDGDGVVDSEGVVAYSDIEGDKVYVGDDSETTYTYTYTDPDTGLEVTEEAVVTDIDSQTISNATFAAKANAGQQLVFVDTRGNILNEYNGLRSGDYEGMLEGVSLNFNPEDEFSLWGKYTFTKGILDNLSLNLGFKYVGPSATSVQLYSASPLNDLSITPEVEEYYKVDMAASYQFELGDYDCKIGLNVYNVLNDNYDVTISTLSTANPITGEEVTKRTIKYYSPISYRLSFAVKF